MAEFISNVIRNNHECEQPVDTQFDGSTIPENAVLYDDGTAVLYDDDTNLLYA
jgi:hypothetical protein